jgi:hypothetical protein
MRVSENTTRWFALRTMTAQFIVMLNGVKHLSENTLRCFAALNMTPIALFSWMRARRPAQGPTGAVCRAPTVFAKSLKEPDHAPFQFR